MSFSTDKKHKSAENKSKMHHASKEYKKTMHFYINKHKQYQSHLIIDPVIEFYSTTDQN